MENLLLYKLPYDILKPLRLFSIVLKLVHIDVLSYIDSGIFIFVILRILG